MNLTISNINTVQSNAIRIHEEFLKTIALEDRITQQIVNGNFDRILIDTAFDEFVRGDYDMLDRLGRGASLRIANVVTERAQLLAVQFSNELLRERGINFIKQVRKYFGLI